MQSRMAWGNLTLSSQLNTQSRYCQRLRFCWCTSEDATAGSYPHLRALNRPLAIRLLGQLDDLANSTGAADPALGNE